MDRSLRRSGLPPAGRALPATSRDGRVPTERSTALRHSSRPRGTSNVVPESGRVCVFRALPGIGDLLCAVPALRAIRRSRPDVSVTVVTLPGTVDLARRFTAYVDDVVAFPGFPGLPDRPPAVREIPAFLADLQARRFDLAIQLHGSGELTNEIVSLFAARHVAAYHRAGQAAPQPAHALVWDDDEHEVLRWLRLIAHLGWPSDDTALELPLAADADTRLEALLAGLGVANALRGRPFAVVHPGASIAERRWPADAFARVVDRLASEGIPVVLTGGRQERELTGQVAGLVRTAGVTDLAGLTTLDTLGALLRRAALLVANDTGVSHVAAALRTPSIVVFTGSSPARWAPLDSDRHRALEAPSPRAVADAALATVREGRTHAA